MRGYSLGIDLGTTSIGWAAIADEPVPGEENLIAGVRIFPEGVDRDTKGLEKSKMAQRREKRQTRHQLARRRGRKARLRICLRGAGLLPPEGPEFDALIAVSPYAIRRRGLDEALTLHELGRALLHLNQRRGFRSSRKRTDKAESKIVGKAVSELRAKIKAAGARTVGEYLAGLEKTRRLRNRGDHEHHAGRDMVREEFEALWAAQVAHHPGVLTAERRDAVAAILFHQRPLKVNPNKIGKCELLPGDGPEGRRAPRGSWLAQEVRILQDVNNMFLLLASGERRGLSTGERKKVLDLLSKSRDVPMAKIREALGLGDGDRINLERQKRTRLLGNGAEAALRKIFKKEFEARPDFYRHEVWESLVSDEDEEFEEKARAWGLTEDQIEALWKADPPEGHARLCREAMRRLLPHLRDGKTYSEAVEAAGLTRGEEPAVDLLPPAPMDIANPIVRQALVEVRRVVNLLIRERGKPSRIVVEMARETKGSSHERNELLWENRKREREREEIRQRIQTEFGVKGTGGTVLRYRLWEEQQKHMMGACPYCGRRIDETALMAGNPDFHIDHILPYSRSLDDSFNNKIVCHTACNHQKGNRLPLEAWGDQPERWAQIEQTIAGLRHGNYPKWARFSRRELDTGKVIERQLNDTRYICRVARGYLQSLFPPGQRHLVQVTRGQVTSELRYRWGLNTILSADGSDEKNRADNRHHAVDAVVIALTTAKHIHNLARREDFRSRGEDFPSPWEGFTKEAFREEVERVIQGIKVSWKPLRHVRGELHEETNYGKVEDKPNVYVRRKPLDGTFSRAAAEGIRDATIRALVLARLDEHGGDPKKAFAEPLYLKNRRGPPVPIRSVRVLVTMETAVPICRDGEDAPYRWVKPGSNHHIAIFEHAGGKRSGMVVSMMEAAARGRAHRAVIDKRHPSDDSARFLFSLSLNDTVRLDGTAGPDGLYRVQEISVLPRVVLRPATLAVFGRQDREPLIYRRSPSTLNCRKVTIDALGREFPAHD